ncbi:hypothetical protein NBRC116493_16640 [Aurantivibrio infirmus]
MATSIVSIYKFRLQTGVDENQFLDISNKVQEFLSAKRGFSYRSVSKSSDGEILDINYWSDDKALETLDAEFAEQEDCKRFLSMIDQPTLSVERSAVLLSGAATLEV